ncbi:hypothetical protein LCGC14_1659050 [marine sediment metagenome]|uniref:Uncharacterized protein n=1 Tax=marine sediment metagenome TaxID=412755 RepID=A0A0F9HVD7_9ZZZZ
MENGLERGIFELLCYMIVSARNLEQETKMYGPFRLVDAASRLIEILEESGIGDEFLSQVRSMIEANKYKVMTDKEGFVAFLDDLALKMVGRLKEAE